MSLEVLNAVFTAGTFVVIAATAVAAAVQLRHLRQNNELQAMLTLRAERSPALENAFEFTRRELAVRLHDPAFRAELEGPAPSRLVHEELTLIEYFEHIGTYVKHGLIDESVYFEIGSPEYYWPLLEPAIAIYRRTRGPWAFENFEYLTMRSLRYAAKHPDGVYPRGAPRLPCRDAFLAADSLSAPTASP